MGFLDRLFHSNKKKDDAKSADIFSRFDIVRASISGTMSNFHMAKDRKNHDVFGLKLIDMEKFRAFESRFKGLKKPPEGIIALKMVHPYIVKTLEYGQAPNGQKYILMEYLDGIGLNQAIKENDPLLDGNRMRLIRMMAESLAHVHKEGFIHRDVCPRNYICSSDRTSVKLIDFGLTIPATAPFMAPGNRTGTPRYMAPEIIRRRNTDQRVDLFALGASIYELITGDLPWTSGEVTGKVALEHDTVKPRPITELKPDLDPTLAAAVMKSIEANPDKRQESVDHFLKMIRKLPDDLF
jgi:serine/threonine protein kinase